MGYKRNEGRIKKAEYFYRTCMWGTGVSWSHSMWIHSITSGVSTYKFNYYYNFHRGRYFRDNNLTPIPGEDATVWEIEEYDRRYQLARFKKMSEEGCLLYRNKKNFRKEYNRRRRHVGRKAEYFAQREEFDAMDNLNFDKDKTYWRDVN